MWRISGVKLKNKINQPNLETLYDIISMEFAEEANFAHRRGKEPKLLIESFVKPFLLFH